MRKICAAIIFSALGLFAFDYNLKPKKINENIWCFLGHLEVPSSKNGGFLSNSCYIKTNNSYVVVDTGGTYEFARQAYASMSKIAKLPVKVAINTHYHDDHWIGSSFYKEQFNTRLLGPQTINSNFKKGDQTRLMKMLPKTITYKSSIVPMDEVINEEKILTVDGIEIKIIPMGVTAHTSKDLYVYLPQMKTLFSGDTVMNGRITSNRDGSVIGQIKAHEKMNKHDWIHLIPGHGHNTSKTAMDESKLYFKLLKSRVLKAVEDEVGVESVTKVVKLEEFKDKAMYNELNKRNIFDAYSELEFYEEE